MLESKIQSKIIDSLLKPGRVVIDLIQTNKPGIADLLVLERKIIKRKDIPKGGLEICVARGIEVKRDGEQRRVDQRDTGNELEERVGFITTVLDSDGVVDDDGEVEALLDF